MRRAPQTLHSYYLFPAIVRIFVAQPVVATLFTAASGLLEPPLALTRIAALWSLERGGPWFRVAMGLGLTLIALFLLSHFVGSRAMVFAAMSLMVTLSALCAVRGVRWLLVSREITVE